MHCNDYKTINHQLFSTRHISLLLTDVNMREGDCCLCSERPELKPT